MKARSLLPLPLPAFTPLLFSLAILFYRPRSFPSHLPSDPPLPTFPRRESTVITVQSCCFSFIRLHYSKRVAPPPSLGAPAAHLAFIRPQVGI